MILVPFSPSPSINSSIYYCSVNKKKKKKKKQRKMALSYCMRMSKAAVAILVTASILAVTIAETTIVGGDQGWRFGFNHADWAFRNSPFYLNDTLVFKYDPPNGTTFPHSVYLLPDYRSFLRCDLRRAKLVANPTQGGGEGFKFVLKRWQPHYFVCGERAGFHCRVGLMKFVVTPFPRCDYNW